MSGGANLEEKKANNHQSDDVIISTYRCIWEVSPWPQEKRHWFRYHSLCLWCLIASEAIVALLVVADSEFLEGSATTRLLLWRMSAVVVIASSETMVPS